MDAYALHLLGMAVEACDERNLWLNVAPTEYDLNACSAENEHGVNVHFHRAPTLADALAALLRDLGVEVPEGWWWLTG